MSDDTQTVGFELPSWTPPVKPARIKLVGDYCRLEPLDMDQHAQDLFHANSLDTENRLWTYMHYGPFSSLEDYKKWLQSECLEVDPLFFAVLDVQSNKAIGLASYLRIDPINGSIEVGHLCYSPLMQRTVAATEAMYLMMKQVFELGYRRYEWKCNSLNQPSRRAAQRLGFSYEGLFRQATVVKGRNRDTAWYSIIDREWPKLKAAYEEWLSPVNFEGGEQKIKLSDLTSPLLACRG